MMARTTSHVGVFVGFATILFASACGDVGTVDMLLQLEAFGSPSIDRFRSPRVQLVVEDEDGDPATAMVDANGEVFEVDSPIPVACVNGECAVSFRLRPGSYRFALEVFAQDQCGTEGQIMALQQSGPVDVVAGLVNTITFSRQSFGFDDDEDGIENAFEMRTCGRFDRLDDDRRWTQCADPEDPCCTNPGDPRIGALVAFDALSYLGPDETDVFVDTLYVDATEATVGTLRRCVAARQCLVGKSDHPAWDLVEDPSVDDALPITRLTPAEAQTLCNWLGKRLPTSLERDRVAAGRADGDRDVFPWGDSSAVGCQIAGPEAILANHRALNQSCEGIAVPVGQFTSSDRVGDAIFGVDGEAFVADLAGNVAEWTIENTGRPVVVTEEVPDGITLVTAAGGGFNSLPFLLENGEAVQIRVPDPTDPAGLADFQSTIARFASVTGFRCVTSEPPQLAGRTCGD